MTKVVGIRFKPVGKIYYFNPEDIELQPNDGVIVETTRGIEYGTVVLTGKEIDEEEFNMPIKSVLRKATDADYETAEDNKKRAKEAYSICLEKIAANNLEMNLVDVEYTFDRSKVLFYFTADGRVDFRQLVKDLAAVFRTRIELRQIGVRDEAKLLSGFGICGRPLCCAQFLGDFEPVSIKMAKEQSLSLNPTKISGTCGRLMCCLKYEHEAYEYEIKRTPPVDSLVRTENGDGIVTEISPLQGTVRVRLLASPDVPPKSYHRDNVTMLRKKQDKQ